MRLPVQTVLPPLRSKALNNTIENIYTVPVCMSIYLLKMLFLMIKNACRGSLCITYSLIIITTVYNYKYVFHADIFLLGFSKGAKENVILHLLFKSFKDVKNSLAYFSLQG